MKFNLRTLLTLFPWVACALMAYRGCFLESQRPPVPVFRLNQEVVAHGRRGLVSDVIWQQMGWNFDRQPWWYEIQLVDEPTRFQHWHQSELSLYDGESP